MSDPGNQSNGNENTAGPNKAGEQKPDEHFEVSPWFGPLTTAEAILAKINRWHPGKAAPSNKYDVDLAGGESGFAPKILAIAAALILAAYAANHYGFLNNPNHVVAVFTLVLSVIAGIQWLTTLQQMKQTDAIITQMRDDKRAWLSVTEATVHEMKAGETVKCTIKVSNTADTPARITNGTIFATVRVSDFPSEDIIHEFELM